MKIDVVVSHISPTLGLERAVISLVQELRNLGVDVHVIAFQGGQGDADIMPGLVIVSSRAGVVRFSPWRAREVQRHIRRGVPVLYAGVWAALPMLLWVRAENYAVIWEHSLIAEKLNSDRKLWILSILARIVYRRASAVVCVSDSLRDDMRFRLRDVSIETIPNIVPLDMGSTSRPTPERKELVVLLAGSLSRTKNQALAIRTVALPGMEKIRLRIAGDGPLRGHLQELAVSLGVASRVDFLGHLDSDAMSCEYQNSDCVFHASLGETFGYAYFEAAAWSKPVIAVDNRVARELIPRYIVGSIVDERPESAARALLGILAERPMASDFVRARSEREAVYSSARIVAAWKRVFGW